MTAITETTRHGTTRPDQITGSDLDDVLHGTAAGRTDGLATLGVKLTSQSTFLTSAVGSYVIGADGTISDIRFLVSEDFPGKPGSGVSRAALDVAEGARVGFFVLPHAMQHDTAGLLSDPALRLEFRTPDGAVAGAGATGPLTLWAVAADGSAERIKTSGNLPSVHAAADASNGSDLNGSGRAGARISVNGDGTVRIGFNEGRSNATSFNHIVVTVSIDGLADVAGSGLAAQRAAMDALDHDTISGGLGKDAIHGHGGNDLLIGGEGKDTLLGGDGNDLLRGDDDADRLDGGTGNDTLFGGAGDDRLLGRAGNDQLVGGSGADDLHGGDGHDQLFGGNSADTLIGDKGNDSLVGGDGDDILDGGSGDDQLFGGSGNDVLTGSDGSDSLVGGNGADTLSGGSGADALFGGDGDDSLDGGSGADWVEGGTGNDLIRGGSGNDTINGQTGDDLVYGGTGDDVIEGGDGADVIWSDSGNDTVRGGSSDDTLHGGDGDDLVQGGGGFDAVHGGRGNDTLQGDAGNDLLDGSHDDDVLLGGTGSDRLIGGEGSDTLSGGQGADTFVWRTQDVGAWADVVTDFEAGYDRIDLTGLRLLDRGWTADSFLSDALSQQGDAVQIAIGDLSIAVQSDTGALSVVDVWGSILFA